MKKPDRTYSKARKAWGEILKTYGLYTNKPSANSTQVSIAQIDDGGFFSKEEALMAIEFEIEKTDAVISLLAEAKAALGMPLSKEVDDLIARVEATLSKYGEPVA